MNTPIGLFGIVEPRAVGLDALGDHLEAVALADDAPVEDVGEIEHRLDLVGDHLADRNAGPVGDDGGDRLLVDMGVDHPLLGDRSCRARRPWRARSRRRPRRRSSGSALRRRRRGLARGRGAASAGGSAALAIFSRSARISSTSARSFVPVRLQRRRAARAARRSSPSISAMRSSLAAPRSRSRASDCLLALERGDRDLARPRPPRAWRSG